jgi:hypothetical protein
MKPESHILQKSLQKINFEINRIKEFFLFKISLYDKNFIVFDGGLGSQLLSYFQYVSLEREGLNPKVNVEYFTQKKNSSKGTNFILRSWALDRYGINLSKFSAPAGTPTSLNLKIPTNLLFENDSFYFQKFRELDLRSELPIDDKALKNFLRRHRVSMDYYAIHLRRGDILTTASVIVPDSEVLILTKKLFKNIEKRPIFIFSDSKVNKTWISELKKIGFRKIILCGPSSSSQFETHDLMRNAKILVASNSTFSLTAGLLARKDQLTIIPMRFYSGYRDEPVNKAINQLSNFSILS